MQRIVRGFPQGTVIGPILFLIMVDDIRNNAYNVNENNEGENVENVENIKAFADDSKVFGRINNVEGVEIELWRGKTLIIWKLI